MQLFLSRLILVRGLQGNGRRDSVYIKASGPRCSHEKRLLYSCLSHGWEEDLSVKEMILAWGHTDRDGKRGRQTWREPRSGSHLQMSRLDVGWRVYEHEKISTAICTGACLLLEGTVNHFKPCITQSQLFKLLRKLSFPVQPTGVRAASVGKYLLDCIDLYWI